MSLSNLFRAIPKTEPSTHAGWRAAMNFLSMPDDDFQEALDHGLRLSGETDPVEYESLVRSAVCHAVADETGADPLLFWDEMTMREVWRRFGELFPVVVRKAKAEGMNTAYFEAISHWVTTLDRHE